MNLFLAYVEKHRGLDLTFYRKNFLLRRVKARFLATRVNNFAEYIRLLKKDAGEWNNFLDNLSINVSEFFRDPEVFFYFKESCLPQLLETKKKEGMKIISCWSCGCACGEEPYSLAITLNEFLKGKANKFYIRIWATDIDSDAIRRAEEGTYAKSSLNNADEKILKEYFLALSADIYKIKEEVKKFVIFKKHNLHTDKPLECMDVVFLRNVRIYFNQGEAEKVIIDIANSMKKNGYLVLGKAETLPISLKILFEPVNLENKVFKRI